MAEWKTKFTLFGQSIVYTKGISVWVKQISDNRSQFMERHTSTGNHQHQTYNAHSCLIKRKRENGRERFENTTNIQNMVKIEGNAHGRMQ